MVTATVTSKGQITIPKDVRTSLGLHAGDRVAFVVHGQNEAVLTPITRSVDDVFGKLHKENGRTCSVEQMNSAIADRMRSRPA